MDCRLPWRTAKQNILLRAYVQLWNSGVRYSSFSVRVWCGFANDEQRKANDALESPHAPRSAWTDGRCCCFDGWVSVHRAEGAVVRADVCRRNPEEQANRPDL